MENPIHTINLSRMVVIGSDLWSSVKTTVERLGYENPVILDDPVTRKIIGKKVSDDLNCEHRHVATSTLEEVNSVADFLKEGKYDVLISIGGGSVIDVGKLASFNVSIPFISYPTVASHDGIASSRASIRDGEKKLSIEAQPPIAIIADTKIVSQAPYRFLASGCADLISNCTAVLDWQLAHKLKGEYYSEHAAALSSMSAKVVIDNADAIKEGLEESARKVLKGLISSGVAMSIASSSRPASGAEHAFAHALDMIAEKPAMHGEQCGVGAIMTMYLHREDEYRAIKEALEKLKAPTTAAELGVTDQEIIKALTMAHKIRDRYTILGESGLTEKAATKLAKVTGVIE
ncbi:MAG: Glycerol-1-phosphate dehydrogenase (NAD(P)+) [Candidatus Methanofastidiosum methylothiophilum]|jgi:glycerol-1-phosphate dehydrogenase [NAD(P)+]|uniref:Glycerol-1-phosphate dehydrogenase [NAD(P)+] n=1 Tax=Candidatus Methanofastidiosum methylothiophilum TaxID=1705564 RepID=A0A150JL35_9EURY|nr:MAG: Glycerol-1-phosphate dehydrogenase (NAD(P)+) [Candidatus Methanofastidiosum methylthiophilus]MBP6931906.1 NAD(P)-dependent glycerol-1-phosphate dehydrogenase [Methanofastidiosum sp.]OQC52143.1 MAG: Glycerol-1-phosphate dehydrogenase (NAD(P)+) [Euryarchaeota archaeon ADurb.Bin023]KYC57170.1 MAG: Glycerol-1-phosphate dehydrogenase (NAD(P)+) [Candidatus Methanofastidiosum methylthiophilus]KYC57926.1 MAG: Glycerol-1-phosphate dehydrogenase [NAD(P)+] [Candidatus Methanofastidiosum methylthio